MKKLTIIAALLGTVYFANAQVGIGTPDPALSAELDIVSSTKGILIPRIALKELKNYDPIAGTATKSLLVYNTANVAEQDLAEGFYYWENNQWNRIVNRTELNEVINSIGGNIENIQKVINFILPSNPDNDDATKPGHTTIVYDKTTQKFYDVTWDATKNEYVTNEINFNEIIAGFETETVMLPVKDANDKITGYMYFNETAVKAFLALDEKNEVKDITVETVGGITLDVKGDVVNNIKEILESKTEIIVDGITFTTVEEYLQYITQFSEGNVIYSEVTQKVDGVDVTTWEFQYWDGDKYVVINLDELIQSLETETVIVPVIEDDKITGYKYFNEKAVQAFLAKDPNNSVSMITGETEGGVGIEVKGDVVNNIKEILESKTEIIIDGITFTTVEEYLQYITQFSNGNVIYTEITVGQDDNGDDIKKWVFQYWDEAKEEYVTINLDELVKGSETETNLKRSVTTTKGELAAYEKVLAPVAANVEVGEIFYQYINEKGTDEYINMTQDIITSIENNEEVKNAITKVLNEGGNVYFGDHDNNPTSPDVFYTINEKGEKVEIILSDSFILNLIERNIQRIKNMLGDKINNTTIINTGDQIGDEWVYKFLGTTTVGGAVAGAPSAVTNGIELPAGSNATGVVSVTLLKDKNIVANNVTAVTIAGNKIGFNLGTGNHYTALPAGAYDVIIEFTSSNIPASIIGPSTPAPVQP